MGKFIFWLRYICPRHSTLLIMQLLHRVRHDFGLSGTVLDFFSSYLSGRIQSVSVHSHASVPASVSCGVPQGSVLGPILFVLYTTPLPVVIERHSILHHSYAVDSQLQNSATPDRLPDLIDPMRLCFDDIKEWMTDNKLKLKMTRQKSWLFPPVECPVPFRFPTRLI